MGARLDCFGLSTSARSRSIRWMFSSESVTIATLAFSSWTMPPPIPGVMKVWIWGTTSETRRNVSSKSLVAIFPLGGRSSEEPRIISGASLFAWESAVTFRNRSPMGETETPFNSRSVSSAVTSSAFGMGRVILSE